MNTNRNEIENLLETAGQAASEMNHRMKLIGNGDMWKGLREITREAYWDGKIDGISFGQQRGIVKGTVGTALAFVAVWGGGYLIKKLKYNKSKGVQNNANTTIPGARVSTNKELLLKKQDEFPWATIKERITKETDMAKYDFQYWLNETKHYKEDERMIVEVLTGEIDANTARERYQDIVKQILLEETGKNYKVIFI